MIVYISGPMTGYEDNNFPAFHALAEKLQAMGHTVINPANTPLPEGSPWSAWMREDLKVMLNSGVEAIVTLPEWWESRGAGIETLIGTVIDIPILDGNTMEPYRITYLLTVDIGYSDRYFDVKDFSYQTA